jgi:hypothetical protein
MFQIKNPFAKKVTHENIRTAGHSTAKIEPPFRFVPHLKCGNSGLQALMDLVEDEKLYQSGLIDLKKA